MKDKILEELDRFLEEREKGEPRGSARAFDRPAQATDKNPAEAGRMGNFLSELKWKSASFVMFSLWAVGILVFIYIALKTSGRYDSMVFGLKKLFSWFTWVLEKG